MRLVLLVIPLIGLSVHAQDELNRELQVLIQDLRSDNFEVRERATRKLRDAGTPARSAIEPLLRDQDSEVRYRAKVILEEIDRREQVRIIRTPVKRATVDVKNAGLADAVAAALGPFDLEYQIRNGGADVGIISVTMNLEKASFWEVMDELTRVTRMDAIGHDIPFRAKSGCSALTFSSAFQWPFRWDTLGDTRIYAGPVVMGGGGENHGNITARLSVVFPPWAVPEKVRVEEVKIAGQPIARNDLWNRSEDLKKLPREAKKVTALEVWRGKDTVSRESLKGADSVTVEGILVVMNASTPGKEVRVPFKILNMPVPPMPRLR